MLSNRRASTVRGGHGTYARSQGGPTLGHPQTTTAKKTTAAGSPGELPAPLLDDPPPSDPINAFYNSDEDSSMVPAYLGVPASTTPNVSPTDARRDDAAPGTDTAQMTAPVEGVRL